MNGARALVGARLAGADVEMTIHLDAVGAHDLAAELFAELDRERGLAGRGGPHDDEELWIRFTEDIVQGMGGDPVLSRSCAVDLVREWERHENFFLYDDALPALEALRAHGLWIGLVSNGQRDLDEFARHHGLDVDVCVGSMRHGHVKPHHSIFEAALAALDTAPSDAAMVGDSFADDIEGARALGMRAILLDREALHAGEPDRIDTLLALPAALGLPGGAS